MNYTDQLAELNKDNYEYQIGNLLDVISESDFIAVDFELTGYAFPGQSSGEFRDNLMSVSVNSAVQLGLMCMKKDSGTLLPFQINDKKSVWKIPICFNGITDDSIWQGNSLEFLKKNKFNHEKWKSNSIDHRKLIGLFIAISKGKPAFPQRLS